MATAEIIDWNGLKFPYTDPKIGRAQRYAQRNVMEADSPIQPVMLWPTEKDARLECVQQIFAEISPEIERPK